ncbi:ABC transporter ATP-binding protein [Candidatus Bathyarchaeota archaeon]|nr:ABC transporter ATP-binding protein [Candidatus Bathyarchaeota archaeon]
MHEPLLKIRNLKTYFFTYAGVVKALDGINLDVYKGETMGLVGETGCGKSVTSLSILRLIQPPGRIVNGEIWFKGKDLLKLTDEEMRKIRGKEIAMVFQDPATYINPVLTIGDQIAEVIMLHQDLKKDVLEMKINELTKKLEKHPNEKLKIKIEEFKKALKNPPAPSKREMKKAALKKAVEVLKLVKMPYPEKVVVQYPHELSGGMRQRAMIAMALSCKPDLLIADEATTALDVTIQAQILNLLNEIKKEVETSILVITHDLGLVAEICDRVAVMYAGHIIEEAETFSLFKNPMHPYTKGLLNAIPKLHDNPKRLKTIPGFVPNLINPPSGCRFHPRCEYAMDICQKQEPKLIEVELNHKVSCHLYR